MPAAKPAESLAPKTEPQQDRFINLSGYRFIDLDNLPLLQADLESELKATGVLGTVLLADEGINVALAGTRKSTDAARDCLEQREALSGLWLKESVSDILPFSKLKVRTRREIIAFDGGELRVREMQHTAPAVSPEALRKELDSDNPPKLLDTRNDYEIASGGFNEALTLGIDNFRDFRRAVDTALTDGRLSLDDALVTFCTGGIRCEKAAPWLAQRGFSNVRQIEGGILNWLATEGSSHWSGDCFVFDDRVAIDAALAPTGQSLCTRCHHAVSAGEACSCSHTTDNTADAPTTIR